MNKKVVEKASDQRNAISRPTLKLDLRKGLFYQNFTFANHLLEFI